MTRTKCLTPIQKETVEKYAQGMTYPQLAEYYDVSVAAIRDRLELARKKTGAETTKQLCESMGLKCIGHKPTLNGGLTAA
ncbi:MAG: helix-turn-helix transcriptional regulator [Leptolyngbyaceae cyanobacterium]